MTSFSSICQWYESQGQASTKGTDTQTARKKAMEEALQKALLVAGASVSSIQQVVNGLLTQDEISIRASGIVNSLDLISETYIDDIVTVNIRADIFPQQHQCSSADYRKTLLVTRANIVHREQANVGLIYDLDVAAGKKLSSKLNNDSQFIDVKLASQNKTEFSRLRNSFQAEKIKQLSISLSALTNSQYIMFSEINDISFAKQANNDWQFWQSDIFDRHFNLSVFIYNGVNGESVFEQHYTSSAPWTFDKREQVYVNSDTFWRSPFGVNIEQTLDKLIKDIDENMMCRQARGKIVRINNGAVTINLGRDQGVKIGDEFSLLHLNNFTADDGKVYAGYNISPYKVKVDQVTNQTARAYSINGEVLGSVQINDIAVRHE
ncbi:flagellar assembly protein T N-terminal domain-containing protein [Thalassotalea sp. PLHSN55]|uniref:flagellar assembly protein T N-terminal domain-containing protein n=1 Tax=Thalassotalea sp. PLHSN55 TaxID=3435888 RepID=UPI003F860472